MRNKLLLTFDTIRYLKLRQIFWRLFYLIRKKFPINYHFESKKINVVKATKLSSFIKNRLSYLGQSRFNFLSQEQVVRGWNDKEKQKLWLYNLHYFDYLLQDDKPKEEIINKWIEENPIGVGNGWEPYPTSLRIVNWIKYHYQIQTLNESQISSLYNQTVYLSKNIEWHILGNHLFENGKTLYIAGLFFQDEKFLKIGGKILNREIKEQILDDGAHFELSPMYHCIILEGLLDVYNFTRAFNKRSSELWVEKILKMLNYLEGIIHPDGEIVCFNDSTFEIAKKPSELFDYAIRLGLDWDKKRKLQYSSGLVRFEKDKTLMFIDAGAIGPDYLPGHAHADNLTFELSHRGQRLIVDTGISTYERNYRRQLERSTRSHNTVIIDDSDQSEVWASFRVARRVKPKKISVEEDKDKLYFTGGYTGLQHKRNIQWITNHIKVTDIVEGIKEKAESVLHFHPAVNLEVNDNQIFLKVGNSELAIINFKRDIVYKIDEYEFCKGFNNRDLAKKIIMSQYGAGTYMFECEIILL